MPPDFIATVSEAEKRNYLIVLSEENLQHQPAMRHKTIGHQVSLDPVVTEALDSISCISSMKYVNIHLLYNWFLEPLTRVTGLFHAMSL